MPIKIAHGRCFVILIALSSCYSPRYVYSPSTQNIPQVSKKGDFNIAAGFATGGGSSGAGYKGSLDYNVGMDINAGYAVTDHLAVIVSKYNRWEKNNGANAFVFGDSAVVKYKRGLTEIGAGYFSFLRKDAKNASFGLYTGAAFGKFKIDDHTITNGTHSTRFHYSKVAKIFIQPAIVTGLQQNFTASFSSRFSMLFYRKAATDYTTEELNNYLLENLSASPVFFWEPAMNYSVGFKQVKGLKVNLQTGFAMLVNRRFVDYRTINIALGVVAGKDVFRPAKTKQPATK